MTDREQTRRDAEEYATWTRQVSPPVKGPYERFWLEAAQTLQRALDLTLAELEQSEARTERLKQLLSLDHHDEVLAQVYAELEQAEVDVKAVTASRDYLADRAAQAERERDEARELMAAFLKFRDAITKQRL